MLPRKHGKKPRNIIKEAGRISHNLRSLAVAKL